MLTDARISSFASFLGELEAGDLEFNRRLVATVVDVGAPGSEWELRSSETLRTWSIFISYITVAIEGSISILFLFDFMKGFRNILLMGFIVVTYPFLPVVGFASLLSVLGLAHAKSSWFKPYLVLLGIVQLFNLPIQSRIFGRL